MWTLLKSTGLVRWNFWKSFPYIAWRLHTVYGVDHQQGLMSAVRQTIQLIGLKQMLHDVFALNRWLKSFHSL